MIQKTRRKAGSYIGSNESKPSGSVTTSFSKQAQAACAATNREFNCSLCSPYSQERKKSGMAMSSFATTAWDVSHPALPSLLGDEGISQTGICLDERGVLDAGLETPDLALSCIFLLNSPLTLWP